MITPDIGERTRVLQASLRQVRRQTQYLGSGAAIHTFINQISTANAALRLVDARRTFGTPGDMEMLLGLAEDSLRAARALVAITGRMPVRERRAGRSARKAS